MRLAPVLVSLSATWLLFQAGEARAQGEGGSETARDPAAAEVLFEEGRALLKKGLIDAACPKFAESYRLDPALGSLLNLAACHEEQGRLATAWGEYRDAEQVASREGDKKRERFAAQKVRSLEPRLPKLRIVAEDPPPGLVVRRDDVELSSASLGVAIPVDPGQRTVSAEAPGFETWSTEVTLLEKNEVEVSIPALTPAAPAETPPGEPDPPDDADPSERPTDGSTQRMVGLLLGGAGVASFAAAGAFALLTAERQGFADDPSRCPEPNRCNQEGFDAIETARSYALVSTICTIAGAALLTGGAVVFLTAPDGEGEAVSVWLSPAVGPGAAQLRVGGSF